MKFGMVGFIHLYLLTVFINAEMSVINNVEKRGVPQKIAQQKSFFLPGNGFGFLKMLPHIWLFIIFLNFFVFQDILNYTVFSGP